jgi:hypothetical protein
VEYSEFIANKRIRHLPSGIAVAKENINPILFPFQNDVARWCLERGKSCMAMNTGLGKTLTSLEWAKQLGVRTLLLAPLAVGKQTEREAIRFSYDAKYSRKEEDTKSEQIVITNYEMMDHFDASRYEAVIISEASIMKSFEGKTKKKMLEKFAYTKYKLPETATPSPNDDMELGNLAEFVGAMSRNEMLAMFFTHDGGNTSQWRLKGHAEDKFWQWVASWMVCVQSPSDLGYDNGAYALPKLHTIEHAVDVEDFSSNTLFATEALTLADQRKSKKNSLSARIDALAEVVHSEPDEQWLVWCELNIEGDTLEKTLNGAVQIAGCDKDDFKESAMLDFIDGNVRTLVCKPSMFGYGLNLQNCARQAFVSVSHSWEGTHQAIRRSWRFGQKKEVYIHQFYAAQEAAILRNLKRKQASSERQIAAMVQQIQSANGLSNSAQRTVYNSDKRMQLPNWLLKQSNK